MLKIDERPAGDGEPNAVHLRFEDGVLSIVDPSGTWPLPPGALEAVMTRFGKPLDPDVRLAEVGALDVGEGRTLRHVRHLARYDVIARDYLVYAPGAEPLCVLAVTAAGALEHLARAARAAAPAR
jgi:hypothetical protein